MRVFENRVLRRIFRPKRDEVTREWRKLHNEELNDFYSSRNIMQVIKLRRMRWVEHVADVWCRRGAYCFWRVNVREDDHLEDSSLDGKIILRWIFRKWDVGGMD
jgi:hypothetical protein